jgi:methyl-accepting chemotaxis protein
MVERTTSASRQLASQADDLMALVAQFRFDAMDAGYQERAA